MDPKPLGPLREGPRDWHPGSKRATTRVDVGPMDVEERNDAHVWSGGEGNDAFVMGKDRCLDIACQTKEEEGIRWDANAPI